MDSLEGVVIETLTLILEGEKEVEQVDNLFRDLPSDQIERTQETVLDTLWTLDADVSDNVKERLVKVVKRLQTHKFIDTRLMKTRLEVPLLEATEIVEPQVWGRKCIRINTAMTYKQQKYNLLREESEGYAKLIHELTLSCHPEYEGEDEISRNQRVDTLLDTIKTLIGYFHLDPNRVLDIILDEFILNVKPHHEFFLRLLEISPWRPPELKDEGERKQIISCDWTADTGNLNCAELLGTKFSRYDGNDMGDSVHNSLYRASALLISRGLVKISDLYPYTILYKATDDSDIRHRYRHEKGLAQALLEIGDLQHSCYLLLQLPSIDEHLAKYLCKIFEMAIFDIYNPIAPISLKPPGPEPYIATWYKRWKEGFPVIKSFDELLGTTGRLLIGLIGPWFSKHLVLFTWMLRICRRHILNSRNLNNGKSIKEGWFDILRLAILPSVSMSGITVGVVNDVWDILSLYPLEKRFGLYHEWKRIYDEHDELKLRRRKAVKKLIKLSNQMTSEDYKQKAREIAMVAHSRPTVTFDFLLRKVKMNPDLIEGMVEVCKYLDRLDFDILTYMIVESLIEETRPKLKEDGVNPSDWMQRMATFVGKVCSKFEKFNSENITVLLQYVLISLRKRSFEDLVIISQIVTRMSGIVYTEIPSETDLVLMAGGKHLRDTKLFNRSLIKNYRKGSIRLSNALISNGLAVQIAVLLAQMAQSIPFETEVSSTLDLKSVIGQADICRRTFIQYVDFLAITADMDEFASIVPSIIELCNEYALKSEHAFMILRPVLNNILKRFPEKLREYTSSKSIAKNMDKVVSETSESSKQNGSPSLNKIENSNTTAPFNDDIANGPSESSKQVANVTSNSSRKAGEESELLNNSENISKSSGDVSITESSKGGDVNSVSKTASANAAWLPPLLNLFDQVSKILPSYVWSGISPAFYVTFWQLSLYDLECPRAEYQRAIQEIQNQIPVDINCDPNKDKNKYVRSAKNLEEEFNDHSQHIKKIDERLKNEKEHWFSGQFSNRQDIITQLWQYCLFPRLLVSPDNAIFCSKFIERMHKIGTANFSTLTLYDRIFADQLQLITFTCSEAEARNYGIFLRTILQSLSSLHRDERTYNKIGKGRGIPGFQMKWSSQNRQPASVSETDLLGYQDFRRVFYKWHSKLYKAFEQGLQSQEYLSLRNSIIVISTIHEYFPAIDIFGKKIENLIKAVIAEQCTKWKDIEVLAISYSGRLQLDKKNWVALEDFRHTENSQTSTRQSASHSNASQAGHSSSPAQRITQAHGANRASPLPNVRSAHSSPSHANTTTRTDSPRRQIHPLPDKPQDRIQKERDREREDDHDKIRIKDKKEVQNDHDKETKKIDDHKEIKKSDHHDRDRGRDRDRSKAEVARVDGEKRKSSKERLPIDDRGKRAEYHPRVRDRDVRDRDEKVKDREKRDDRRDDRRDEKRDKGKEKERERSRDLDRDREREHNRDRDDRDRHRNDNGRSRRHDEVIRRTRKNDHDLLDRAVRDDRDIPFNARNDRGDKYMGLSKKRDRNERDHDDETEVDLMSKKRSMRNDGMAPISYPSNPKKRERTERERDDDPEPGPITKRGSVDGLNVPRTPVKLNRSMEHINELMAPMPSGGSFGGKRNEGDKRELRRRY
ncbi:4445_t:CDS:2 [Acaulospora morrowiae]|uniref:THO complex subunit 2 n=1 Tax=Acaulospora morrowiae TaxID=94023 RepID=A0A9N8YPP5_9GLOM|nr:4445_t:CDS:2 [Acaulospora morrowiae]